MLPTKFRIIWPSSFRGENFRNWPIRNKNCLWQPCLIMNRDEISTLYRGPPIDATYHVSVHLAKRFQRRRFFLYQPIRNKNCLWRPCLLMDWDEMIILYRGHSIDSFYQVSVHLAEGFQRRRFKCEKLTDDRRRTTDDGWRATDDGWRATDDGRRTTDAKWWQKLTLSLARWAKKDKDEIGNSVLK